MDVRSLDWTRLHPKELIDRNKELEEIERAFENGLRVVYLIGKGGIGKTRLLEEMCRNHGDFVTLGVFDVYHSDYHKVSGVERAIVEKVRKHVDSAAFRDYDKVRKNYLDAREKGMSSKSLEELRRKVAETFWKDFGAVIKELGNKHLMLCFDTMELLFHETDEVETLLGDRPRGLELADWLNEAMGKDFPNLHFLLSGRPERDWWVTLSKTRKGEKVELGPLDEEGVADYLSSIGMRGENPEMVYGWTRGEPLRLVFVTILRASGIDLPDPPVSDEEIDKALINQVMNLTDDTSLALPYIAFLAKGVTPEVLSRAMSKAYGDAWSERKAEEFLGWFRNMPFVKIRPSYDRIFLHDEMYRVMRQYVLKGMEIELAEAAGRVVEYYREHENLPRSETVYYYLCSSWRDGFDEYRKLSDEAIAEHRTGDDLLLRDEVLRFVEDHGYKNLLPQITKDATIRWPKRLIAMGEYQSAKKLAAKIREQGKLNSLTEEEQQVFSVYEAEAKIYTGDIELGLKQLEKARERLKIERRVEPTSYEGGRKVQACIRALNDIGYANARRSEYWKSAESYREALNRYLALLPLNLREKRQQRRWESAVSFLLGLYGKSMLSDWADTLKNLSFVYSKLGFHRAAYLLASESNRMYHSVGNEYGRGMTMSTKGAIFIEREWYCNARRVLEEALRMFGTEGSLPDERGKSLALLSMGQALRKLVDMENIHGREEEFENLLSESEEALKEALQILEKKERSRLSEVYQALGCLYRDRLAFLVRSTEDKDSEKYEEDYERYEQTSKDWFKKAERTANELQKADIYIDWAELDYHCCYREGYGVDLSKLGEKDQARFEEHKAERERLLNKAIELVPGVFRHPYRPPYPPEEQKNTIWWKVMGKAHLLKGHVAFKAGNFEEAIEEYLESFLFFDLYSEEASLFSIASRSGRRLYSKFSRIPEDELLKMENVLLEKGSKRRILDRQGWRSLLALVQDARLHGEPYVV